MQLLLRCEAGAALLQRLDAADLVLEQHEVPDDCTEFDCAGWARARLVSGDDGKPFVVLVCNTNPEHALDTTVHDGGVVEEHDVLRPSFPRRLGSSKVMDCWQGDVVTMFSLVPLQLPEPTEETPPAQ